MSRSTRRLDRSSILAAGSAWAFLPGILFGVDERDNSRTRPPSVKMLFKVEDAQASACVDIKSAGDADAKLSERRNNSPFSCNRSCATLAIFYKI
jgi:hypothetical protein